MKYFKKLVGENIYLSPINVEDKELYVKWLNDFSVTDGLGGSCKLENLITEQEWIQESLKKKENQFAIVKLENEELIGGCGFHEVDHIKRIGTLGIFIGEEQNRGKGYGKEALNLLLEFGFQYLNLNNIMLHVFSFNERAIHCYKKIGFQEIGRRRQSNFLNGTYYDTIYMDMLKSEFKGNYIKNKNI